MNFYLPTREECQEIVKNNETFYCTSRNVDGFDVELYDYRLASYTDYFPSIILFKENDDEFYLNEELIINNKALKDYSDEEIEELGFFYFKQFVI